MKSHLVKLYEMLSASEKRLFYIVWVLMFFAGVMQVLGIASILPFMTVLSNRQMIYDNKYLNWVYSFFNFNNEIDFLIFLAGVVIAFIFLANFTIAFTRWVQARFVTYIGIKLQNNLLEQYLHKPYTFFLKRNTATLSKTVLGETYQAITNVMVPGLEMINQLVISIMILVLLVTIEGQLALFSFAILGGLFYSVFYLIRRNLRKIGKKRVVINGHRFKAAQEALSGVKEIKLMGKEAAYLNQFSKAVRAMLRLNEKGTLYQQIPPIIMEVIVMTGIMGLLLYLLITEGGLMEALPTISLFAFAAFRLKPSLQSFFQTWSKIKYHYPALENVMEDMDADEEDNEKFEKTDKRLSIKKAVTVDNITFRYPDTDKSALEEISIEIKANTSVAFVGPTGSGKTTLVDVLLGLLKVQSGSIKVDGVPLIGKHWREWQNNIGYIPQHIYLTDDTVAANIAFGISHNKINDEQVLKCSIAAHLHEFIEDLPQGYNTVIGERGIRLSGGQRQRIGIARALYHNPDVLVMDEATSALDNITEASVMEAIHELSGTKTILMIAHRLTTVKNCDKIFLLQNGKITDEGTYEDLLETNQHFQQLNLVDNKA